MSRAWTCPRSTSAASPPSTGTTSGCTIGSARSWACTTPCRGRTASWPVPGRSGGPRRTTCSSRPTRASAARWAGSGRTSSRRPASPPDIEYGWGQQNWQPWSSAEQRAARTGVALFDQTSFSKYLVTGRDAEQVLQWLCTADVAVEPGRTVYTGMLNAHGTYEADITVTRLSAERVPAGQQRGDHRTRQGPHHQADTRRARTRRWSTSPPTSPSTASWARGRGTCWPVLSRSDLGDEAFPFGSSREIDLGYATVRATRITYVGELGWELYVPAEFAVGAYEDLVRPRAPASAWRTPATTRSSRCGWRRPTGPSAAS